MSTVGQADHVTVRPPRSSQLSPPQRPLDQKVSSVACPCFEYIKTCLSSFFRALGTCIIQTSSWITFAVFKVMELIYPEAAKRIERVYLYLRDYLQKMHLNSLNEKMAQLEQNAERKEHQLREALAHNFGLEAAAQAAIGENGQLQTQIGLLDTQVADLRDELQISQDTAETAQAEATAAKNQLDEQTSRIKALIFSLTNWNQIQALLDCIVDDEQKYLAARELRDKPDTTPDLRQQIDSLFPQQDSLP